MTKYRIFSCAFISLSIICILIIGSFAGPLTAAAKGSSKSSGTDYTEGDSIVLGSLDGNPIYWTILTYDSSTGTALVASKNPIRSKTVTNYINSFWKVYPKAEERPYETWSTSYWKAWLNGTFYTTAFNNNERSKIKSTSITKAKEQDALMNLFHDTTLDAAYARELVKYSLDTTIYDSQAASTNNIFFLSFDEYTEYKDTLGSDGVSIWPLRTNSYYAKNRMSCVDETNAGLVEPYYHYCNTAIRPAMYLQLKVVEAADTASNSSSTNSSSNASTANTTTNTATNTSTTTSSGTGSTATSSTTSATGTQASAKGTITRRSYANNATNANESTSGTINLPLTGDYTIKKNGTAQVTIDLSYLNSSNKQYTVTYSSSDNRFFTVDSAGKLTAGTEEGGAVLSVRMKKSNGKVYSMTCNIKVE